MDFAKSLLTHVNRYSAIASSSGSIVQPFPVSEFVASFLISGIECVIVTRGGFPVSDDVVRDATLSNLPLRAKTTYCLTTSAGVSGGGAVPAFELEQVKKAVTS